MTDSCVARGKGGSARQRYLFAARCLTFEPTWPSSTQLGERLAIMVANDQAARLQGPLAAGEKISRATALRRDRAFGCARRASKCHAAEAGIGRCQHPPP